MTSNLWSRANYLSGIPYIIGQYITEYDIAKANINILLYLGAIDRNLYDILANSNKEYREIYIGKLQRENPQLSEMKSKGIEEFRKRFIQTNQLEDKDILSIKSDAVFVLGKSCQHRRFENVEFKVANVYNAFMHIGNLEIYYGFDTISGDQVLDVKGINDKKLELHRDHMMLFLCDVFYRLLHRGSEEAIKLSNQFLEVLLTRSSPDPEFYRSFDMYSGFTVRTGNSTFILPSITPDEIPFVDLSANVKFMQGLLSILSDIYLKEKK